MNIRSEADIDIEPEKTAPNQQERNDCVILPAPRPLEQCFGIDRLQTLGRLLENQKRGGPMLLGFNQLPSGYRPLVRMQRVIEIGQDTRRIFPCSSGPAT